MNTDSFFRKSSNNLVSIMSVFRFILSTSANFKGPLSCMIICTALIAIDANLRPYILKLIIDQSYHFNLDSFIKLSGFYLLSQVVMIIANSMFDWCGTRYHTRHRAYIIHNFLDKLTQYPYSFFQETQSGAITARISDAFNTTNVIVFTTIRFFIQFILLASIAMTALSTVSHLFVLAAAAWIVIFLALTAVFYKKYEPLNADFATVRPKIYGFLSDYFTNILSVWFFNRKNSEKTQCTKLTDEFVQKSTLCGQFLRNYYTIHGVVVALYMMIILIVLGYLSNHGQISPGDFALVFMINYKIVDSLFEISNVSREFVTNCGVVTNAIKILDEKIEIQDKLDAKMLHCKQGRIVFDKIKFCYKNTKCLFNHQSLVIEAGQKVGLVGYSGSGKTTFANLLLRLYEITDGHILIDDQDIYEVTQDSLRSAIAMIPQDPTLFNRSLMENIGYGKIDARAEEIVEAAKKARAHNFISKLPQGYDSLVGERGIKLSGGQRQRIAIARAILKDAPILILDEATSQLDSITENEIQKSLLDLVQNKTAIIIAHRLSTLLHMDRILVFDEGEIVEDGSHEELLKSEGLYQTLWEAQVGGFLPEKKQTFYLLPLKNG